MEKIEIWKTVYSNAHQELLERIKLRDNMILLYLALCGTLFGIAFQAGEGIDPKSYLLLLVIPYLAFGASILLNQHVTIIAAIGKYLSDELYSEKYIDKSELLPPSWDNSKTFREFKNRSTSLRSWGHSLLILIPSITSLLFNIEYGWNCKEYLLLFVWWVGLLLCIYSFMIIVLTHNLRKIIYFERRWYH